MSLVTTLWAMEAAAALTLGVLYGVVWGIDRRNLANLTLCILAVAMVGVARAEVGMMHAATVAEYALLATPFCRLVVVIFSGDAAMTIVSGLLVVAVSLGLELSVTVRLTVLNVPALVGVPVMVAPVTWTGTPVRTMR